MAGNESVTLLVPTKNRSDFVIRLLRYYSDAGFSGTICIGDSSGPAHAQKTTAALHAFQDRLQIVYQEFPDVQQPQCQQRLVDLAPTPYVAYAGDDDFLVPAAVHRCAQFLDEHPDYGAAHGVGLTLALSSDAAYGAVSWVRYYRQPVIESESAAQRLHDLLGYYAVPLFSVVRAEFWREMANGIAAVPDRFFAGELIPGCVLVVLGKVKELNGLYLIRQGHSQTYRVSEYLDWVTGPAWNSSFRYFCGRLTEEVAQRDGQTLEEAERLVKRAFRAYLTRALAVKPQVASNSAQRQDRTWRVPHWGAQAPERLWRVFRRVVRRRRDPYSLEALLRTSSPYHQDFLPVYRAITSRS